MDDCLDCFPGIAKGVTGCLISDCVIAVSACCAESFKRIGSMATGFERMGAMAMVEPFLLSILRMTSAGIVGLFFGERLTLLVRPEKDVPPPSVMAFVDLPTAIQQFALRAGKIC